MYPSSREKEEEYDTLAKEIFNRLGPETNYGEEEEYEPEEDVNMEVEEAPVEAGDLEEIRSMMERMEVEPDDLVKLARSLGKALTIDDISFGS